MEYVGQITAAINVSDFDRSIDWYTSNLGLEILFRADEVGWCDMLSPVSGFSIGLSKSDSGWGDGGARLTLGVPDAEAAMAELQSKGVVFDGPIQVIPGMVKLASFRDPDGNPLMLAQTLMEG